MPAARKRGSQEQGRRLQAYVACRCHCGCFRQEGQGCRLRQMTTTSLHGSSSSSSFVALKKRIHPLSQLQARGWVVLRQKKPTPACSCMQGGGLLSSVLRCHCQ